MSNNITKVNVEEINALTTKLNSVSKIINANIKSYQKNLDSIEKTGYLKGAAEFAINDSCQKIASICSDFDEYAKKLIKELNEVVGQTQRIETEEKLNIEDIISQDPTTYSGGLPNYIVSTIFPMMTTAIKKMKEHMSSQTGTTGAVLGGEPTVVDTAQVASKSQTTVSTKEQSTSTSTKTEAQKPVNPPTTGTKTQSALTNYKSPYSDTNVKNEQEVYTYLTKEMGLNDAAAAGVMANIYAESRFKTGAIGDSGTSYGMFQVHAGRKDNLMSWCKKNGYDPSSVEGQMARFEEEVTKVYSKTETALYNASDSVSGARNAASVMTTDYERPANASSKAQYRADLAEHYYKQIKAAKL